MHIPDHHTKLHKVEKIIVHPDYNPNTHDNNIALVRLVKPFEYSERIQSICVADDSFNINAAPECYIGGFGTELLCKCSTLCKTYKHSTDCSSALFVDTIVF